MAPLASELDRFPWEDKSVYSAYLAQTYYYVKHSTRLLAAAACRFEIEEENLHVRYLKHAAEEKSHHFLALNDLKAMGHGIGEYQEYSGTSLLYQPQYYLVSYKRPTSLFGYILALEGAAALNGQRIFDRVSKAFSKDKTTFLKVHSVEDLAHVEKAFQFIEKLKSEDIEEIKANLVQSVDAYMAFYSSIMKHQKKSLRVAA